MITKLKLSDYATKEQKLEALYEKLDYLLDYQTPKYIKSEPILIVDGLKGNTFYTTLEGTYNINFVNVVPGESGFIKVYITAASTITPPLGSKIANGVGPDIPLTSTPGAEDIINYYMDECEVLNFSVISNLS
jgi:hypothetical protein